MRRVTAWIVAGMAAALIAGPPANAALIINIQNDGSFSAAQLAVITAARDHWLTLLGYNNGDRTIRLSIQTDNAMGELGSTGGWVTDGEGNVTSARIRLQTNGMNWTTGAPTAGVWDAWEVVEHEMTHALGWTVGLANFAAKVLTISGNRFFDLDRNGVFSAGDFDLVDDPLQGTHAAVAHDLMSVLGTLGERNLARTIHAQCLAQVYGFRVIPAPSALAALAFGLFATRRRRRAA